MNQRAILGAHGAGQRGFWRSRAGLVFTAFAVIAASYLLLEHRAHVLPWLPFGLLLLCPLMHLFMHGGHGGHSASQGNGRGGSAP